MRLADDRARVVAVVFELKSFEEDVKSRYQDDVKWSKSVFFVAYFLDFTLA